MYAFNIKNLFINKLDQILNKYSKTYMKPVDEKLSMYIDFIKENNKQGSKCKVGDNVKVSKYKSSFSKGYAPNWSKMFCN